MTGFSLLLLLLLEKRNAVTVHSPSQDLARCDRGLGWKKIAKTHHFHVGQWWTRWSPAATNWHTRKHSLRTISLATSNARTDSLSWPPPEWWLPSLWILTPTVNKEASVSCAVNAGDVFFPPGGINTRNTWVSAHWWRVYVATAFQQAIARCSLSLPSIPEWETRPLRVPSPSPCLWRSASWEAAVKTKKRSRFRLKRRQPSHNHCCFDMAPLSATTRFEANFFYFLVLRHFRDPRRPSVDKYQSTARLFY